MRLIKTNIMLTQSQNKSEQLDQLNNLHKMV